MTLRTRLVAATATAAIAGSMAFMPALAEAAPPTNVPVQQQVADTTQPVTGTLSDGSAFTGALSNLSTTVENGVMQLTGTITGTGLPAGGETFSTPLPTDALQASDSCQVLTLNIQPLHLDLLGLVVDLDAVNLDVTAVPGAGNLLGNLVCAVAGLLDRGGPTQGISALLNRLLTGLGLGA